MNYRRTIALSLVLLCGFWATWLSHLGTVNIWGLRIILNDWWKNALLNFGTGMFGSFVTYILITIMIDEKERQREKAEVRKQQIEQDRDQRKAKQMVALQKLSTAKSTEDKQAIANEMRNLDIFIGISLWQVNLDNINLEYVNLTDAHLVGGHFSNADFDFATLTNANLEYATLDNASFEGTFLMGTNFTGASLKNARFQGATFDRKTRLPDNSFWAPGTTLDRFTDPSRSDFWDANLP